MAYDEQLAARVRDVLPDDAVERRMFGGLGFMIGGHLAVSVGRDDLMVRVGIDGIDEALAQPGASPCVMGERTMRGWVLVDASALDDRALAGWAARGSAFAQSLPAD